MSDPTVALVALLAFAAYAGGLVFALYWREHRRDRAAAVTPPAPAAEPEGDASWVRGLMMEVIIVHTDIGLSYEGLLVLESPKGVLLRNPKLLDDKRSPTTMAGELWIDRAKVHAVQTKPIDLAQLPAAS
jgi:hypothetical protein